MIADRNDGRIFCSIFVNFLNYILKLGGLKYLDPRPFFKVTYVRSKIILVSCLHLTIE